MQINLAFPWFVTQLLTTQSSITTVRSITTRKAAQPCCAWPVFSLLFVLYEILFDACDSCGCIVHKEPLPDWWFCAMQAADCFVEGVSALGYLMIWSASFCIQNHFGTWWTFQHFALCMTSIFIHVWREKLSHHSIILNKKRGVRQQCAIFCFWEWQEWLWDCRYEVT